MGLLGLHKKPIFVQEDTACRMVSTSMRKSVKATGTGLAPMARLDARYWPKVGVGMMTSSPGSKKAKAVRRDQLIGAVCQNDLLRLNLKVSGNSHSANRLLWSPDTNAAVSAPAAWPQRHGEKAHRGFH